MAYFTLQVLLHVCPLEKHLSLLVLEEKMLQATNLFASITSQFKTFSKKIAAYISKCESLHRNIAELDLLLGDIQKLIKDFDVGQAELVDQWQRVMVLKDQCSKILGGSQSERWDLQPTH